MPILHRHVAWQLRLRSARCARPARWSHARLSTQTVSLPRHDNEALTLSITTPARALSSVLLHVPGAHHASPTKTDHALAASSQARVVTVHIGVEATRKTSARSQQHKFPTPIHELLRAWDWVLSELSDAKSTYGVYGEGVGGSLALMLAMTECRVEDFERRVSAVAVHNAVCDWVSLDLPPPAEGPESQHMEQQALLADRDQWFPSRHAARYFDPFASPIHFLRTPLLDEPNSAASRMGDSAFFHPQAQWEDNLTALALLNELEDGTAAAQEAPLEKKRKFIRKWPPSVPPLVVPRFRFGATACDSLLGQQALEMATELRKALVRDQMGGIKVEEGGKGRKKDDAMVEKLRAEVEGVVEGVFEEEGVERAGDWLGEAMRRADQI